MAVTSYGSFTNKQAKKSGIKKIGSTSSSRKTGGRPKVFKTGLTVGWKHKMSKSGASNKQIRRIQKKSMKAIGRKTYKPFGGTKRRSTGMHPKGTKSYGNHMGRH